MGQNRTLVTLWGFCYSYMEPLVQELNKSHIVFQWKTVWIQTFYVLY